MGVGGEVKIRPLTEDDVDEADRIVRLAFGTFLGLPDPSTFMGDAQYARTRFLADPTAVLAAELDGRLVGSNFVTRWGSVGFFGPLTVLPELWDKGVAKALLRETEDMFARWGVSHRGLFTFANSPKHVSLYQSLGYEPGPLTGLLGKAVSGGGGVDYRRFSEAPDKEEALAEAAGLTDELYPGLDVAREIRAVDAQGLGDTVLVYDGPQLVALGVCHLGAGSEAGSGVCYVKFGAARPGADAERRFARLLAACEAYAASGAANQLLAGVSLGRRRAYHLARSAGFRPAMLGVTLHQPDSQPYHDADSFAIDDWR